MFDGGGQALGDLLLECGINNSVVGERSEFPHRLLVFAQHRQSLDLIEQMLLAGHPELDRLP